MTDEELKAIEVALGGPLGFTYDGSSAWSVGPAADPQSGRIVVHDRNDERAKALCAALVAAPSLVAEVRRLREVIKSAEALGSRDPEMRGNCPWCGYLPGDFKRRHAPECPAFTESGAVR